MKKTITDLGNVILNKHVNLLRSEQFVTIDCYNIILEFVRHSGSLE